MAVNSLQVVLTTFLFTLLVNISTCFEGCKIDEFLCEVDHCISNSKECDGFFDCSDGSDESKCDHKKDVLHGKCEMPLFYKCRSGKCIASIFKCNGYDDCDDFSDEDDCAYEKVLDLHCPEPDFLCLDKRRCISQEAVCNGYPDCRDGSDETVRCHKQFNCTDGFRCKNQHCIIQEFHCDGSDDCGDNSDEEQCFDKYHSPDHCPIEEGLFLCRDGYACFSLKHVCDNFNHCFDASDEHDCGSMASCANSNCSHKCHVIPGGVTCSCSEGYLLARDGKSCVDIDECAIFGTCGQRCKNTEGSFQCSCDNGYALSDDRHSCKAIGGEALLLYASTKEIRGLYVDSEVYYSVAQDLNQVTSVSHNGDKVYWSDFHDGEEAILRSNEEGSDRQVIVSSGLGLPEDMQVDYVTGNIYITDSQKKHIGVCSELGDHCTAIVNVDIDKPRALALLPIKGLMYWTDWGKVPMIATSGMDGSNPYILVHDNIHWPNGLTIDFHNDRLYWVDAKLHQIGSAKLDGSDAQIILKHSVVHPYSIAVFEESLYWSDWKDYAVQKCHKFTGKNRTVISKEGSDSVYGVHIYHPLLHPRIENPCEHAGCEGICLLAPNKTYTCACGEDSILRSDHHSCQEKQLPKEIAVINGKQITFFSKPLLGRQKHVPVQLQEEYSVAAFNSLSNSIFLVDADKQAIHELHLDTHATNTISSHHAHITSLSFDPLANNLYYCDDIRLVLGLLSLNTKEHLPILRYASGRKPLSVVVVPGQRLLFVAVEFHDGEIQINKVSIDKTSEPETFLDSALMGVPVSLAYDIRHDRLYWFNSFFKAIESIQVDGTNRAIDHITSDIASSLEVHDSVLYWTSESYPRLHRYSNITGDRYYSLGTSWRSNMPVVSLVMTEYLYHPCHSFSNGGCSHVCLAGSGGAVTCLCPDGYHMNDRNETCERPVSCSDSQFECSKDNRCISRTLRCDGTADCTDGEDESYCKSGNCSDHEFQCMNGQCVPKYAECNYKFDCADKSDENHCTNDCGTWRFRCGSGECLSELFVCDGHNDCKDNTDEYKCEDRQVTCYHDQFNCRNGKGPCVPKSWECDDFPDCSDGSDEHDGCAPRKCNSFEFKCDNNLCVDEHFICNGEDDCGDDSDERSCASPKRITVCSYGEFLCSPDNSVCVPDHSRCNFTAECPRGEDELNCEKCHPEQFLCKNKNCVPIDWLCDGQNDCSDNSDEEGCHSKTPPRPHCDGFQCHSGECLSILLACDNFTNCQDGSDEGHGCETSCKNHICQGTCKPMPTHSLCSCGPGFHLHANGHTCVDINECLENRCSQICVNTPGSFTCSCKPDYLIMSNRETCKAIGGHMTFIVGSEDQVRNISWDFRHTDLLIDEFGQNMRGMDIDARNGVFYYSSDTSDSLNAIYLKQDRPPSFIIAIGHPEKISVDWITGNVFFVDKSSPSRIGACHFSVEKCSTILEVEENEVISQFIVDPISGYIFYAKSLATSLRRPLTKIYRFDVATGNSTLLASYNVVWVTGFAIDNDRQLLYWTDLHEEVVERITFDGKGRQIMFYDHQAQRPVNLVLFEDVLYWLSKGSGEVTMCNVYGENIGKCHKQHLHMYDAKFFSIMHPARQPERPNPCKHVSCGSYSICVTAPNGHRCVCQDGTVMENGNICEDLNIVSSARIAGQNWLEAAPSSIGYTSGIFLTIFLTMLVMLAFLAGFIFYKKHMIRGPVVLETFHFQNPTFGVSHVKTEFHHALISPGRHEYVNQTAAALVEHPNGEIAVVTEQEEKGKRLIKFQECDNEDSDHYEDIDMTMNLIP